MSKALSRSYVMIFSFDKLLNSRRKRESRRKRSINNDYSRNRLKNSAVARNHLSLQWVRHSNSPKSLPLQRPWDRKHQFNNQFKPQLYHSETMRWLLQRRRSQRRFTERIINVLTTKCFCLWEDHVNCVCKVQIFEWECYFFDKCDLVVSLSYFDLVLFDPSKIYFIDLGKSLEFELKQLISVLVRWVKSVHSVI